MWACIWNVYLIFLGNKSGLHKFDLSPLFLSHTSFSDQFALVDWRDILHFAITIIDSIPGCCNLIQVIFSNCIFSQKTWHYTVYNSRNNMSWQALISHYSFTKENFANVFYSVRSVAVVSAVQKTVKKVYYKGCKPISELIHLIRPKCCFFLQKITFLFRIPSQFTTHLVVYTIL